MHLARTLSTASAGVPAPHLSKSTAASRLLTCRGDAAHEQPSTEQSEAEATSVVGVLITSDLAPLVVQHLLDEPSSIRAFRLLCKLARDSVDSQLITQLCVRRAEAGVDVATQLRLACGMLARGTCRRLRELELTVTELEDWAVPGAAEQLFRSVPRNPDPNRPSITKLTMPQRLLTPEAARAAGAALPYLEVLIFTCDGIDCWVDTSFAWRIMDPFVAFAVAKQQQAAWGLVVLLGPCNTPRAGTAEESRGSAAGAAQTPLLPALRRLELGPNLNILPQALAAPVRAATQLRSLRLHLDLSHSTAATSLRRLSGMTQLEALGLASRNAHRPAGQGFTQQQPTRLAAALAPLGDSLRSLAISFERCDFISVQCFTALRGLQELRLGDATVLASSLSGLSCLTRLHALFVARTAPERAAGTRFRLPPQLRALRLSTPHPADELAALEPLRSLRKVSVGEAPAPGESRSGLVQLWLARPTSVDAASRLSPAGEEALCRTAALLSGADTLVFDGVDDALRDGSPVPLLMPPSHPAPGFEGHGRWLSAWGGNGLRKLVLWHVALSAADLATIARCMTRLKRLVLGGCSFPVGALTTLASLPRLRRLDLARPAGTELPAGLKEGLQELRARAGPRLRTGIWVMPS